MSAENTNADGVFKKAWPTKQRNLLKEIGGGFKCPPRYREG